MGIAKVTRNFQVTIPRDIRRIQGISIGDTILFAIEGDKVDLVKMDQSKIIEEMFGSWKDVKEDSLTYVRSIRKGWSDRSKRLGL